MMAFETARTNWAYTQQSIQDSERERESKWCERTREKGEGEGEW